MTVRRTLAAAVAVVAATTSLSSCGFGVQTEQVYNQSRGVDDRSGSVDVLNALIVADGQGSGSLVTSLVNNDTAEADGLRAVAGAGEDSGLQLSPGGESEIPAGGVLNLAQSPVTVTGERIVPGNFVQLTFSFQRGESATLKVPVMSADDPEYADVPLPSATPTVSPSAGPSESPSAGPSESPSKSPSTAPSASPSASPTGE